MRELQHRGTPQGHRGLVISVGRAWLGPMAGGQGRVRSVRREKEGGRDGPARAEPKQLEERDKPVIIN